MALSYFQGNEGVKNASRRLKEFGHQVIPKDPGGHLHPRRRKRYADPTEPLQEVEPGEDLHGSPPTEPVPEPARPVKHFKDWKAERAIRKRINLTQRALAYGPPVHQPTVEETVITKEKKDGTSIRTRERRTPEVVWPTHDRRRRRRTRHSRRLAQRSRRLEQGNVPL